MEWNVLFFFNSVLLGVGLAMDAFSVSLANGLNEPKMKKNKMCGVAGVFAMGRNCSNHSIFIFFKFRLH